VGELTFSEDEDVDALCGGLIDDLSLEKGLLLWRI
jgi:hypothetical protein